ncbi:hypothetical protein [Streptococcus sanguinis]|uniref:Lipoprotein n=1 Tax=Streptococcus sanguinis SK355 TaxID=888816 RepID=F3UNH4_STRSA|nr:hypothetical protein [Streptococcus sanguinis]EGJ43160.1 hypothetical protein HMPREF9389_0382 [Streptococcus sanguinis SK355]
MKKVSFYALSLLSLLALSACMPAKQTQQRKKTPSSLKASKSSSSKETSSKSSSTYESKDEVFRKRATFDPDDASSLQDVPDAASIPELEKIRNFHISTGFVIQVNGEDINGDKPKTSYDEVTAALGQPTFSTDENDPGNSVNIWHTDNGDIMCYFTNNVLTNLSFRLKDAQPAKSSYSSITTSDTPKTAFDKLGRPEMIMRSERDTTFVYKNSNDEQFSFSTQNNQIVGVMSTYQMKQTKDIIDSVIKDK